MKAKRAAQYAKSLGLVMVAAAKNSFISRSPQVVAESTSTNFNEIAREQKEGSKPIVPVVMCTYRRLDNLLTTITMLESQTGVSPRLFIWNNNLKDTQKVSELVMKDHKIPVKVFHSRRNIGGFGRFFIGRQLAHSFQYLVTIDDDQTFKQNMLKTFVDEFEPKTICGFWAWRIKGDYWDRERTKSSERGHYVGTGGAVFDTSLFLDEAFFRCCPRRYWFIEDLWASYYADSKKGWKLVASKNVLDFLHDNKDQYHHLQLLKKRFLRYLTRRKKWDLVKQRR